MMTNASAAATILERLEAAIGMDPAALEPARLRWIVAARCRKLGLADDVAYAGYLAATATELDALIDEVVVLETRFFRDPTVFEHLRHAIAETAATVAGPLRVLSAPCGTGQEAYSVAALMRLAGVPVARFSIDALDISRSALEVARRGVYPERALNLLTDELRDACGQVHHDQFVVHEELRARVRFERRNLAEAGVLGAEPQYHLILCRNLFIYLGAAARRTLAESLAGALLPGGKLFLGTADRVEELNALFAPLRPAASFAFVHRVAVVAAGTRTLLRSSGLAAVPAPTAAERRGVRVATPVAAPTAPMTASGLYHQAMEHWQRGERSKAERRCRQALYLAPSYLPALELLQILWDQNPNMRLRRALRDRILRSRIGAGEVSA